MKNICVAVLENNRKYLLQLRDNNRYINEYNRWGFFGGQKKQSETPLECIKREIYEELGYNLIKPTYIGRIFNSEFLIHIFHKKIRKKKFIV